MRVPGLPMLRAVWAYRGFVWGSVMREFHGKYRESQLGVFWSVANPLTMIIIYTVVFGWIVGCGKALSMRARIFVKPKKVS